jgi:uncharacterized protein YqeY
MINKIKEARTKAIKENNEALKTATRMILGEVPRLNKKANEVPTNKEIVKIINSLIKSENMTLGYSGSDESEYLKALYSFLPEMISEDQVISFLETVDFSKLKNPMQCIPLIKQYFGEEFVDGAMVNNIVNERFKK